MNEQELQDAIQGRIDILTQALDALRGTTNGSSPRKPVRSTRVLSASAKKRIAAAQKARWAKFHADNKTKKSKAHVKTGGASWAGMNAAQRSAEMFRRQQVAKKKRKALAA
jgi:hypothetical protein